MGVDEDGGGIHSLAALEVLTGVNQTNPWLVLACGGSEPDALEAGTHLKTCRRQGPLPFVVLWGCGAHVTAC